MDSLKVKFLNNIELTSGEIKELRSSFIKYAKIFYSEDIHGKALISDLERESETINGLKNQLKVLLYVGIDPM